MISNLPAGAGLGSSAAYSVCLAAGFLGSCGFVSASSSSPCSSKADADTLNIIGSRMSRAGIEFGIGDEEFCWSEEDLQLINKWGFRAETLIHGTPSGIDNGISTYGSLIRSLVAHTSSTFLSGGAISFKSGVISHLEKCVIIMLGVCFLTLFFLCVLQNAKYSYPACQHKGSPQHKENGGRRAR